MQALTLLQAAGTAAPAAAGQTGAAPAAPGGLFGSFGQSPMIPMLMIFVVFYFLLIRPQQKKQKETVDWLKQLKRGDEVVTSGGLIGKISALTDDVVTLDLADKVRIKVVRSHISGKAPGEKPDAIVAPEKTT